MFKAWVCIILVYESYHGTKTMTTVADIARQADCERLGRIAITQSDRGSTFKCVQIMHTPE